MWAVRRFPFSRRIASHPSSRGNERSMTITSGCRPSARRTAVRPSPATTTRIPFETRYVKYIARVAAWSSTMRASGPRCETDEVVGYFFVLTAPAYDVAVGREIAQTY